MSERCDCDLRNRKWNPHTGRCGMCGGRGDPLSARPRYAALDAANERASEIVQRALSPATVEQPAPAPANGPAIWDLVIADMRARDAVGVERYGRRLRAGDGRNHLVDAYQEALDLAVYLRQEIEERNDLATGLRDLATTWRQGSADGDDRTAADCADELEALLAGGGR